ncbi:MAG: sigma-70 family RNA polymerase sigma factor [Desulfosarcina sp.]|nr:sigma-70 family RNA polymerase sigma factor [Desulfosarcina sp.]MBC2767753.1 sigma-70 family RNA polymerase sigma factor [Desulfosarcina sp.]
MTNTNDNNFRNQIVALLPRMRRFAYTLTSNREDADDLVQAACERALSRRNQWEPGSRLDSWMFRIIHTQRIDMTRSQRSRSVHVPLEEITHRPTGANGKNKIEASIMLRQVLQAMEQLSESDRVVLALVCIEGLSYKDSAATLEVPIGTVMSRLARARHRLHELVNSKDTPVYEC